MGKGYPCLSTAAGCSGVLAQDTAVYYHSGGKAQAKLGYGQVGRLSHSTGTKEPEQVLRIIIIMIMSRTSPVCALRRRIPPIGPASCEDGAFMLRGWLSGPSHYLGADDPGAL